MGLSLSSLQSVFKARWCAGWPASLPMAISRNRKYWGRLAPVLFM